VNLELVEPLDPQSGVAKFLEQRGEGLHHICFDVDDVNQELNSLAEKGVKLIDKEARRGAEGMVAFLHPKSTRGVLTELVQRD
jgi:methylmalonyl-CoA epimerase